jgi:CheY-like chemotaxis protein
MRVLCVDDNRDAAAVLVMLLSANGCEARTAFDGYAAIAAVEEFRPELVLLDLGLPDLDGCEVARQIRQQPWGADMTLVALTGWDREEDELRTREAGFNYHLVKPLGLDALKDLLAKVAEITAG